MHTHHTYSIESLNEPPITFSRHARPHLLYTQPVSGTWRGLPSTPTTFRYIENRGSNKGSASCASRSCPPLDRPPVKDLATIITFLSRVFHEGYKHIWSPEIEFINRYWLAILACRYVSRNGVFKGPIRWSGIGKWDNPNVLIVIHQTQ
jgi:hypothetical protein